MISLPLFKRNMIASIKFMLIFLAVLAMYTSIIIWMFDPEMADLLNQYSEMMPGFMSAMGMSGGVGTLIEFINTYLYGFLMIIVPMIFEVMLVNKLIMKYVDNGSMACLLSTPNSRKKIILTQLVSIAISVVVLIVLVTLIGLACSEIMFPGKLDIDKYISLNFSTVLLHLMVSGIAVFSACFFNESKGYVSVGVGLPIGFYLIEMLSNMGGDLEKLKYLTIYTMLPGESIVSGSGDVILANIAMLIIAFVLYVSGAIWFIKKDLPL